MIIDSHIHFRFLLTILSSEKSDFHYVFRNINASEPCLQHIPALKCINALFTYKQLNKRRGGMGHTHFGIGKNTMGAYIHISDITRFWMLKTKCMCSKGGVRLILFQNIGLNRLAVHRFFSSTIMLILDILKIRTQWFGRISSNHLATMILGSNRNLKTSQYQHIDKGELAGRIMSRTISDITEAMRVSLDCRQGDYTLEDVIDRFQAVLDGESNWLDMTLTFRHEAQRDAFINLFPKYVRWGKGTMGGVIMGKWLPTAMLGFEFHTNIAGERNETGEKRLRKVLAVLQTLE
jgi:hypothetical protein